MAAGAALAAKRGDTKPSDLKGVSKSMADSMSENPTQPRTSSIAAINSFMVSAVSLPMLEIRKVSPLILP
jgi:hypothetical protein